MMPVLSAGPLVRFLHCRVRVEGIFIQNTYQPMWQDVTFSPIVFQISIIIDIPPIFSWGMDGWIWRTFVLPCVNLVVDPQNVHIQ